jgi:hypothetical protein
VTGPLRHRRHHRQGHRSGDRPAAAAGNDGDGAPPPWRSPIMRALVRELSPPASRVTGFAQRP